MAQCLLVRRWEPGDGRLSRRVLRAAAGEIPAADSPRTRDRPAARSRDALDATVRGRPRRPELRVDGWLGPRQPPTAHEKRLLVARWQSSRHRAQSSVARPWGEGTEQLTDKPRSDVAC